MTVFLILLSSLLSLNLWPVFMVTVFQQVVTSVVCKYCVIMKTWGELFLGWLSDLLFVKRQHE